MKIYAASKTSHARYWQKLRSSGVNIISTWIDEAGSNQASDPAGLTARCIAEIGNCDAVLLLIQDDDQPKGAFIEVGAALAFGKRVLCVAPANRVGIFQHHPLVTHFMTVAEALNIHPANLSA